MALTGKKRAFANAVLAGSSNKEAAIAAGYSAATASAAGSRLVKDPAVVAHLTAMRVAAPEKTPSSPLPYVPGDKPFDLAAAIRYDDPKDFLLAAMNDGELEYKLRVDSAKALMPFTHHKLGEGGKKDQAKEAAKAISEGGGKFGAARPPPRLVSNNK